MIGRKEGIVLNQPILELVQLGKKYKTKWAVKDLNLQVYAGEVYGFLGRNGAGKTTTIRMIMDLIKPTTGTVRLFGRTKEERGPDHFRYIGATIEYPGFYPNLTARENLRYIAAMFNEKKSRVDEVLTFMGLRAAADRVVRDFSLGMKQRLGLARALLHRPKLVILDEPTNGLDPAGIQEIRETIQRLAIEYGIGVFVSSHLLSEVEQIATRVGIIHHGTLVEEIDLQVFQDNRKQYLEIKVNNPDMAVHVLRTSFKIKQFQMISSDTIHLHERVNQAGEINRLLHQHGLIVSHLCLHQETLEDHFLRVTGGKS